MNTHADDLIGPTNFGVILFSALVFGPLLGVAADLGTSAVSITGLRPGARYARFRARSNFQCFQSMGFATN